MPKKTSQKTTLQQRIGWGIILPLILLTVIFTAMQLTNTMMTTNELYQIESRFAFDAIYKALAMELRAKEALQDLSALRTKLDQLAEFHGVENIDLYNLFEAKPLWDSKGGPWTPRDMGAIDASIHQKQLGNPYHSFIDRVSKKIVAYMPIEQRGGDQILVARVSFPLAHIRDAINRSWKALSMMFVFIALAGFLIANRLSKTIVQPLLELNKATQEIMKGNLGKHVEIHTRDEIQQLAETFNHMSSSLKEMKSRAEDANPLTGLPGNQGIFHELKKRILEKQKFVLFHTDLDRFKVFNDHFGLARGDEAIKRTAELLKKAVKEKGAKDDFVGHQGGDDFVLITRPNHARELAEYICDQFSKNVVTALYRKEDLERGYTLQLDRRRLAETGEERIVKFPLIAISLAGVSTAKRDFADYFACMSAAVEAKKEAKKAVQSSYVIKE